MTTQPALVPPELAEPDPDDLPPYDVDSCETCGGVGEVPADINAWNRRPFGRVCRACDGTGTRGGW